jgi:hypothetical protein
VLKDRPRSLGTEAGLIIAGYGMATRLQGQAVMHLCANCCWLDEKLGQKPRNIAYRHNMDFCTRPGGGSCGQRLTEVIRLQHEADDVMVRNATSTAGNARSQRSEALRGDAGGQGLNFRR